MFIDSGASYPSAQQIPLRAPQGSISSQIEFQQQFNRQQPLQQELTQIEAKLQSESMDEKLNALDMISFQIQQNSNPQN